MSLQPINASSSPETQINENFETIECTAVYGKRHPVTTGLTWGYYGGRWGGFSVSDGTLTLAASKVNYIVVEIATGIITVEQQALGSPTIPLDWDDVGNFLRVYKVTTTGNLVTGIEDHREGPGGVLGGSGGGGGGGTVSSVNITAPAAGITASGGPITGAGSIVLALADDLGALEALSGTGIARRTGTSTWSTGTAVNLASEVTGVLPVANYATGTPTGAKFVRDDGSLQVPSYPEAMPPGVIFDYAGNSPPPSGFLMCDGAAVSRTTYSALFAVLSTTWGAGNGTTTFNVPNLERQVTMGSGGTQVGSIANVLGAAGGVETHVLDFNELPNHTHDGNGGNFIMDSTSSPSAAATGSDYDVSAATGAVSGSPPNTAMDWFQPTTVMHKIIKT